MVREWNRALDIVEEIANAASYGGGHLVVDAREGNQNIAVRDIVEGEDSAVEANQRIIDLLRVRAHRLRRQERHCYSTAC